jgi:glycosyltransferase involved in cell wall biosynthesis
LQSKIARYSAWAAALGSSTYPALSVVIEWENARNAKKARRAEMLRRLFAQLTALDNRFAAAPEVILVHDADDSNARQILAEIEAGPTPFRGNVRTCACEGLDYYDQKNFGAREARGEAILFIDSDVIPEDGWLEALLECYIDEAPDVVAGATYIHGSSLYERAFALFWFLPMEADYRGLSRGPTAFTFANNVMFRAGAFRPVPDAPLVRARWDLLLDILSASRQSIILEPRARAQHPPPNGVKHFIYRALTEGQDNVVQYNSPNGKRFAALRRFRRNVLRSSGQITRRHREVGLNWPGALGAMFVAFAYYSFVFCGEVVTAVSPQFILRNVRV